MSNQGGTRRENPTLQSWGDSWGVAMARKNQIRGCHTQTGAKLAFWRDSVIAFHSDKCGYLQMSKFQSLLRGSPCTALDGFGTAAAAASHQRSSSSR